MVITYIWSNDGDWIHLIDTKLYKYALKNDKFCGLFNRISGYVYVIHKHWKKNRVAFRCVLCLSCIVPYMVHCVRTIADLVNEEGNGRERWCFAHKWNARYSVPQLIGHSFTFIISAILPCVSKNDDSIWSLRTITQYTHTHTRANEQTSKRTHLHASSVNINRNTSKCVCAFQIYKHLHTHTYTQTCTPPPP